MQNLGDKLSQLWGKGRLLLLQDYMTKKAQDRQSELPTTGDVVLEHPFISCPSGVALGGDKVYCCGNPCYSPCTWYLGSLNVLRRS
jgi:hypothetical protein